MIFRNVRDIEILVILLIAKDLSDVQYISLK